MLYILLPILTYNASKYLLVGVLTVSGRAERSFAASILYTFLFFIQDDNATKAGPVPASTTASR